ncbi:MAG TPA: 3-deoxy-manno-octulosonate cytidylyltransferase, partial [Flavobacteriales bacterium]|nr:3-deoxy-manno-octulosonate cytidylyltransferase [Flavobacteriales bacterium]
KKVVVNDKFEALYFSRSPIPFVQGVKQEDWLEHQTFYKHIGIYAFRAEILNDLVNLPVSKLENAESLEQLRWLENGYTIQAAITDHESPSIDTPADLERLLQR